MTFLGELKVHRNLTFIGVFLFKTITEVRKTKIRGDFVKLFITFEKNRSKSKKIFSLNRAKSTKLR